MSACTSPNLELMAQGCWFFWCSSLDGELWGRGAVGLKLEGLYVEPRDFEAYRVPVVGFWFFGLSVSSCSQYG